MNKISLGGHLANAPTLQQKGDTMYTLVSIINNGYKEGDSNLIALSLFGSTAKYVCDNFNKGDGVIVSGQFLVEKYGPNNEKVIYKIEPDKYYGIEKATGKLQINTGSWTGRLTRDPEIRYTTNQEIVAHFSIAVPILKFKDGKLDTNAVTYINVTAFGKLAELSEKFLKKGSKIYLQGRLNYDSWQDSQKNTHSSVGVIAESMTFIEKAQSSQTQSSSSANPSSNNTPGFSFNPSNFDDDDDLPF